MNSYSILLIAGAAEMRNIPAFAHFTKEWLETVARRMEYAGALENEVEVTLAIFTIARLLTDSGPLHGAPSFLKAVDAAQRKMMRSQR
jgi:hypothetical protein